MPMRLEGKEGSFELLIAGYQFPSIETGKWDPNWLTIEGNAVIKDRSWSFCDPCLTTFEAADMADWLDDLCSGREKSPYCHLVEPNLQFEKVSANDIRVSFALESAPPWATHGDDWTMHGFEVPIGSNLQMAAAQLRDQLRRFPVRGDLSDN